MYALEIGLLRVSKSRSSMFRNALTILLVSAVALLGQYSGPADEQTRTVYPDISQPSDQPSADPDIQTTVDGEAAADQKHGVARISIVQGDVNVKRGDTGELTAAVQNAPLMTQDRLQTSNGSRAEIQLDAANLVRLAPNTDVGMADLQYHRYQIQLGAGTIIYRVLRSSNAQVEVDTPNVGFRPVGEGEFRISVLDDGTTQITARSGKGEIFGPHGSEPLPYGQTLVVRGDANDPEFRTTFELARDQFDDWSEHRDSDLLQAESYRYVSPDIAGAEDLDRYGQWVPSQYGQVWAPQSMPADWSPYSNGEWVWQDYYGWTWVDSSAWGWAPYHYGRWFYNGGYGWCWWPGAVRTSYYWSPALVGFWGWGGFGLRAGLGGLGWCALAPYERFHRWWGPGWYGRGWDHYRYGGRGFRPYGNFTHNADIARMYRNAAYRGGAMMARHNAFGGPHQRFTPATRTHLVNASAFQGGRMPVTPTRASYQFSTRSAVANPRLTSVSTRRFFNGAQFRNPASAFRGEAVQRVAPGRNGWSRFGQAAANGVAQNRQRPAHGVPPNMRSNFGNRGDTSPSRPAPSGWQRFGDPGNGGALREGFTGGNERSGWHRFGQPEPARRSPAPTATPRSAYSPAFTTPRYNAPAYNAPRYSAPRFDSAPRYNAPRFDSQPRFNAPAPRYNAPAPRFDSSPRFNVQPRMSAPRSSGPRFDGGGRFYGAPARPSATPRFSAPHSGAPRSGGFSRGGSFGGSRGGFSGGGRAGGGGRSGGGGHGGGGARHR